LRITRSPRFTPALTKTSWPRSRTTPILRRCSTPFSGASGFSKRVTAATHHFKKTSCHTLSRLHYNRHTIVLIAMMTTISRSSRPAQKQREEQDETDFEEFTAAAATLFTFAFFAMTAPTVHADEYRITGGAQAVHGCGYPSMEASRAASSGIGGTCGAPPSNKNPSEALGFQPKQPHSRSGASCQERAHRALTGRAEIRFEWCGPWFWPEAARAITVRPMSQTGHKATLATLSCRSLRVGTLNTSL
jgi:Protein of unknown function (DUF3551)